MQFLYSFQIKRFFSLSLPMASSTLTEYERKRLENIRRNDEMRAALNIRSKAVQLSESSKRQRVGITKSYKVSPEKKPKSETPIVIRRSLRTRGIAPDSKGLESDFVDSPEKKFRERFSYIPNKSPLNLTGSINMRDSYIGDWSDQALIDTLLSCDKNPEQVVKVEKPKVLQDDVKIEIKVDSNKYEAESCLDVWSLSLKEENIARVVPGRIMLAKFLPSNNVTMVVVGNKNGNVGFWNVDGAPDEDDGIYLFQPHTGPMSGILFRQSCFSKMYTSCYDGFLRLMDVEKEVFDLKYSSDESIFTLSQRPCEDKSLYFSEGYGGLSIYHDRTGKILQKWILHEGRINSIDFSSQNTNIMATSSSDGTARIWDLRKINSKKPESLGVVHHQRAVHSAYFSPSSKFLATTSFDDKIGITSGANYEHTDMIYHNNQTGRWISSFKAIWGWDDSYVFVGNMKRGVDVISPFQRRSIVTLQSPLMTAIPCRFDAHPYKVGMLAGATSGGQIYIWT